MPADDAIAVSGESRRVDCYCKPPKEMPEIDHMHPRYGTTEHRHNFRREETRPLTTEEREAFNRWKEERFARWIKERDAIRRSIYRENIVHQSASTHSRHCNECMGIDFDRVGPFGPPNQGRGIAWANMGTCPVCAFFHAFNVRQGFGLSNRTSFVLFKDPFNGWNTMDFVGPRPNYNSFDTGPPVSIQPALARFPGSPHPDEIYQKRRVYPRLGDYIFIADWLDGCARFHGNNCLDSLSSFNLILGLRFIDCMAQRIIPASEAVGKVYVTLSYVWGASSGSTDERVEEAGSVSLLPSHLPKVIEDSVKVVKELGYRYLWVDRYCIPQSDKRAKHIQIQLMGTIYARSAMTIIAAAGGDAEYGLPGVGSRGRNLQPWVKHHACPQSLTLHNQPGNDIRVSSWSTRGWTYQEALLSKRRLVFTDNQVFFQCQSMTCEESRAPSTHRRILTSRDPVFPKPANFKDVSTVWDRITEFLERNLSFERDALDAISGIFNMYRTENSQDSDLAFLCGLPLVSQTSVHQPGDVRTKVDGEINQKYKSFCDPSVLTRSFLWAGEWDLRPIDTPKVGFSSKRFKRPRRSGFPCWSWVGWKSTYGRVLKVSNPYGNSQFTKCAIRAVYEDHQRDLDWEKDAGRILENSALGLNPKFLDITGTCFDVTVSLAGAANILAALKGREHKFVALLLAKTVDSLNKTVSAGFLLLQPVEHGGGKWICERVTSCCETFTVDPRWRRAAGEQFEDVLEERELRLR
ncbi:heterokaryon incompatibility protein-domain-containing protein [Neurospora crassa]|nr:heterokaryon incompatibility protein-domain-containing protein [Neurospora crassa]